MHSTAALPGELQLCTCTSNKRLSSICESCSDFSSNCSKRGNKDEERGCIS